MSSVGENWKKITSISAIVCFIKIPLSCIVYHIVPLLKAFQKLPFSFCHVPDAQRDLALPVSPNLSCATLLHIFLSPARQAFILSSKELNTFLSQALYMCGYLYLDAITTFPRPLLFLDHFAYPPTSQHFSFMVYVHNHNHFIVGMLSLFCWPQILMRINTLSFLFIVISSAPNREGHSRCSLTIEWLMK